MYTVKADNLSDGIKEILNKLASGYIDGHKYDELHYTDKAKTAIKYLMDHKYIRQIYRYDATSGAYTITEEGKDYIRENFS